MIVYYPNTILNAKCDFVPDSLFGSEKLSEYISVMWSNMYENNGVGLAAPQIGLNYRIIVINPAGSMYDTKHAIAMINPICIRDKNPTSLFSEEGCLSFPDLYLPIERDKEIVVTYSDVNGNRRVLEAKNWTARIIQHECDHINGITMLDRLDDSCIDKGKLLNKLHNISIMEKKRENNADW